MQTPIKFGTTKSTAPPTPLFAGSPIRKQNSPLESYMPHICIRARQLRTVLRDRTRSWVSGQTPPLAKVEAAIAISRQVISNEQVLK